MTLQLSTNVLPETVEADHAQHVISQLDETDLRRIAIGEIVIQPTANSSQIVIHSEVIDYLFKIKSSLDALQNGLTKVFTVSHDYYSNLICYERSSDKLTIIDVHREVEIGPISFPSFRDRFDLFFAKSLLKIESLYPELSANSAYRLLRDNAKLR